MEDGNVTTSGITLVHAESFAENVVVTQGKEKYTGPIPVVEGVVQFMDGNVLVPLLFSEVVNMHPAAIIIAVLFFGGLWGVWGVFFAIPLATLIQAVIHSWPSIQTQKV